MKKRICLIGFMGAGKTTVGKHLATLLKYPFSDLDDLICHRFQQSIPEIFSNFGESYFRWFETQELSSWLSSTRRGVLATGGGIVLSKMNRGFLKLFGYCVFLDPPVEHLLQRIRKDLQVRPLAISTSDEDFKMRWEQRYTFYKKMARFTTASTLPPQDVAQIIFNHLKSLKNKGDSYS